MWFNSKEKKKKSSKHLFINFEFLDLAIIQEDIEPDGNEPRNFWKNVLLHKPKTLYNSNRKFSINNVTVSSVYKIYPHFETISKKVCSRFYP